MGYWEERAERRFLQAEQDVEDASRELEKAFREAQKEIQKQIDAFYGRYARNNSITLEEARKALSLSELKDFQGDLQSFRKLALDSMSTFNLELDNLSVKARITRYEALQAQLDAVTERLYTAQRNLIETNAQAAYADQYYRTLFDVDQYQGFHQAFAQVDFAAVRRIMEYPFDGLSYSQRIWRQSEDLKIQLRQTLNRMFTTGRHPREYAREFAQRFGAKQYEAYRLLYTESAFMTEQGTLQAYKEDEIERYVYTSALDSTTCPVCGELDGKSFAVEDAKTGVNYPPMHPNCRCTTIPKIEGVTLDGTRFARDRDGKGIEVPANMTYEQWKKKYVYDSQKSPVNDIIKEISLDPIKITDRSIGCIEPLKGTLMSFQKSKMLAESQKSLLEFIRDDEPGIEAVVRCNLDFKEISRKKGGFGTVTSEIYDTPNILIHNHPSGYTFSLDDVSAFAVDENLKAIAVVGNNGSSFLLEKEPAFTFSNLYTNLISAIEKVPDFKSEPEKYITFMETFLEGAADCGLRYTKKAEEFRG